VGAVAFDYALWRARYPEFDSVPEPVASLYFTEACLYLDNTDASLVVDEAQRLLYLNMLTAHVAALYGQTNGEEPSNLVGRVASAGEGSVNVSVEAAFPGSAAWFAQTKYGISYWQATSRFRSFRYRPGAQPFYQPPRPYYRRTW